MKKLTHTELKNRREFLKSLAKKSVKPVVIVYTVSKTTQRVFGREPE